MENEAVPGLQRASSALPESFHLLHQQVVEYRKQEAKPKKQKHQRPTTPALSFSTRSFFLFLYIYLFIFQF